MRRLFGVLLIAACFGMTACGDDDGDRDEINRFLSGLGDLPAAPESPPTPTGAPGAAEPQSFVVGEGSSRVGYDCTRTPYSQSVNPDKIVTLNPDVGKMWLGGLLQGDGYAGGLGSLKALPIGNRAPLKVYLDLLDPGVTRTVTDPDAASVQSAIGDLVTTAEDQGWTMPTVAYFRQTNASSIQQGLLNLGFSAKYLAARAEGSLSVTRDSRETTMIASLVQRYYTAAIVTPPTPADYFTTDVKVRAFREQQDLGRVGVGNPPVVVSNISYGRIFLMTVTARTTEDKLTAALSASFSVATGGGTVDLTTEQKKLLQEASIQVIANGGEEADFLEAVRTQNINAFLARPHRPTAARPISFQVDNIADGSAAKFSETANYNLTQCAPRQGRKVTVGGIYKLSGLRLYTDRCNQNIYGTLFVNDSPVLSIPDKDPYLKVKEHNWVTPPTVKSPEEPGGGIAWPQFTSPADDTYKVTSESFPADGFYLTVFKPEHGGPPHGEFRIAGNLNNAIFPLRDDTSNSWNFSVNASDAPQPLTAEGGSPKCGLTLAYKTERVAEIFTTEP